MKSNNASDNRGSCQSGRGSGHNAGGCTVEVIIGKANKVMY